MNENGTRGIEQGRAKFAYDQVKCIADLDPAQDGLDSREAKKIKDLQKKYKSGAKKLPVLIKTNGLGQALAFINGRDPGNAELYNMIGVWLSRKQLVGLAGNADLVDVVIGKPSNEYRRITTETLALLNWVRRFVDSLMADVGDDNA